MKLSRLFEYCCGLSVDDSSIQAKVYDFFKVQLRYTRVWLSTTCDESKGNFRLKHMQNGTELHAMFINHRRNEETPLKMSNAKHKIMKYENEKCANQSRSHYRRHSCLIQWANAPSNLPSQ